MAWRFRGNISGSVYSMTQNLPMNVNSFLLVNKTGGAVTANVYMFDGVQRISMMPLNKSISAGDVYESDRQIVMLATEVILLQTSGSIDYDFYIDNMDITENNISV